LSSFLDDDTDHIENDASNNYSFPLERLYLLGLMVRVLGYRSGGPGSIPGITRFSGEKKRKTVMGLERGPLSLVSITEELLGRKVAAPV
jgi:hypothetical protein